MIEAPPSALRERYQLLRRLGQGGYGKVYEALDRTSGQRVALKELTAVNALSLANFKQEFRAMQEVHHPNLVRLDALFDDRGTWLIAMELVEGTDLLDYLYVDRAETCFDERQLREVFMQLADGLEALHSAGFVHRDLKPENIRVTREERVVLIDFGLATGIDPSAQASRLAGLGTLSYMAPEQADGHKIGPAADWYAFGVCLYQALTGVLPIDGPNPLAMMSAKKKGQPARASTMAPGVPEDLDELCEGLLQIAPAERPDGRMVRRALGLGTQALPWLSGTPTSVRPAPAGPSFEGREPELALLSEAFAHAERGHTQVVLVEGDSGIGKSSLVDRFVGQPHGALVLRSRCYESELLAYKAFDGAIYALANHLCRLSREQRQALMPERAALLRRLFPALEVVDTVASAPLHGLAADPALQRFEAFSVFDRLLQKLGAVQPLILVIDDLQWADGESFSLLQSLLSADIPCLLLATVRPRAELEGVAAQGIDALRTLECVRDLPLSGLPKPCAMAMARSLLGPQFPDTWLDMIVSESGGHPLFLTVLTRFAGSRDPRIHADITLDLAISAHIGALTRKARRLLDTVAVAGAPLAAGLLGRAAGVAESDLGRLTTELCRQKLLRRRQAGQISCFHDRIRLVTAALLEPKQARVLHSKLASVLEAQGNTDSAELARHHAAAGELTLALAAYRKGADQALGSLAFARAALLYDRAGELSRELGIAEHERRQLQVARGHALARGGRSAEAAAQFLEAAQSAEGEEKTHLRIWAAQHLLQSARVEEGMAAAHALLEELALPVPSTAPSTVARIAWDRAVLRVRGLDVASDKEAIGARERMQLDALWGLSVPITWLDTLRGAALTTHHLRLARHWREPRHMARALAEEAFAREYSDPHHPAVDRLLERARGLCGSLNDPEIEVRVSYRQACVAAVRWELKKALAGFEHGHRVAAERCPDQPWLLTNVRIGMGPIWVASGEHGKLASLANDWLAEARDRNDQFALTLLQTIGGAYIRHLMADDADRARSSVTAALAPWPREPFCLAHFGEVLATGEAELYRGGRSAHAWFEREGPRLSKTFMLRNRLGRAVNLALQALALIGAASAEGPARRKVLLGQTRALADALAGMELRHAALHAGLLRAQLAALAGDDVGAMALTREAIAHSEQCGYLRVTHTLRYLQGVLEGGQSGGQTRKDALARFAREGWKAPRKAVRIHCPAVDILEQAP